MPVDPVATCQSPVAIWYGHSNLWSSPTAPQVLCTWALAAESESSHCRRQICKSILLQESDSQSGIGFPLLFCCMSVDVPLCPSSSVKTPLHTGCGVGRACDPNFKLIVRLIVHKQRELLSNLGPRATCDRKLVSLFSLGSSLALQIAWQDTTPFSVLIEALPHCQIECPWTKCQQLTLWEEWCNHGTLPVFFPCQLWVNLVI